MGIQDFAIIFKLQIQMGLCGIIMNSHWMSIQNYFTSAIYLY